MEEPGSCRDGKYFKLNVPNMIEGNEIELKELKLEKLNSAWIECYNKWNRKRERLLEHLATYRQDTLKIEVSGLWRNILYIGTHQHTVFFVFPKFHEDLKKVVDDAKGKCPEEIQQRIHCIFIDDLVANLLKSEDSALKGHYSEFKKKYLPDRL